MDKASNRGNGFFDAIRSPQDVAAGLFLIVVAAFVFFASSDLEAGTLRNMGPGMLPRIIAAAVGLAGIALTIGAFFEEGPSLERWSLWGPIYVLGGVLAFAATIRGLWLDVRGARALIAGVAGLSAGWAAYRLISPTLSANLKRGLILSAAAIAIGGSLAVAAEFVPMDLMWQAPIPGGLMIAGPLVVLISGFADADIRWRELLIFAVVMTALCIGLFRYVLNLPIPVLIMPNGFQI